MQYWDISTTYTANYIVQYENKLYYSLAGSNVGNLPDAVGGTKWALYLDPIVQVYNAIWTLLEAHVQLASMVKLGNRIKVSGDSRDPMKAEISDADLPELRVVPVSSSFHLQRTSNSSTILSRWRIQVSTGDQRVDAGLYALEWEIYRALKDWISTIMALTWNSKTYVKLARPLSAQHGVSMADLQRGIKGWSSIFEFEAEMWFTTSDL